MRMTMVKLWVFGSQFAVFQFTVKKFTGHGLCHFESREIDREIKRIVSCWSGDATMDKYFDV
jgi:hypothetical protein